MKKLSKEEMKKVMGGKQKPSDGEGCEVTCNSGYYACCNRNVAMGYCACYKNGTKHKCDAGGEGASQCKVEHF